MDQIWYFNTWLDCYRLKMTYPPFEPHISYLNEEINIHRTGPNVFLYIAGSGVNFRSLEDLQDWSQNFDTKHVPIYDGGPKASRGSVEAAWNCFDAIRSHLKKDDKIRLRGHSKGGYTCPPLHLILKKFGYQVTGIRTYGAPKFSKDPIDDPIINNMQRVRTFSDEVPQWPFDRWYRWRNYIHHGKEIVVGTEIDEHFGLFRDAAKAHSIETYEEVLWAGHHGKNIGQTLTGEI